MNRTEYEVVRHSLRARGQMGRWELTARFGGRNAVSDDSRSRRYRIRTLARLCRWRRRSAEALEALAAAGATQDTIERFRLAMLTGAATPTRAFAHAEILRTGWSSLKASVDETETLFIVGHLWAKQQRGVAA